jgi:hypothetical protein
MGQQHPQKLPSFYEVSEAALHPMVSNPLRAEHDPLSDFSSWAASLHLVLWYSKFHGKKKATHLAVMDTHNLDEEVLVWHAPHLIDGANHEYLAFGRIVGTGYRAVPFHDLVQNGLMSVF